VSAAAPAGSTLGAAFTTDGSDCMRTARVPVPGQINNPKNSGRERSAGTGAAPLLIVKTGISATNGYARGAWVHDGLGNQRAETRAPRFSDGRALAPTDALRPAKATR
jgi:hypothetical protein